jgi:hypothetical protein
LRTSADEEEPLVVQKEEDDDFIMHESSGAARSIWSSLLKVEKCGLLQSTQIACMSLKLTSRVYYLSALRSLFKAPRFGPAIAQILWVKLSQNRLGVRVFI